MRRWSAFALLVLALNLAWEMMQANWFASMRGLPLLPATLLCFRAALGDLVIAALAFVLAALVVRSAMWPAERGIVVPATIFIGLAMAAVIAYEQFALSNGRWRYDETMPTLFGIGALPLLQWLVLPIIEVWIFRPLFRRVS
jgi:hypothetical protein